MRYVILRDDDTNALTPVECLERLYRPFLDRGLPVNLAVIPEVATGTRIPGGAPEGYLLGAHGTQSATIPIASNSRLVNYLDANPGYRIVQHGLHHEYFEFDALSRVDAARRMEIGTRRLEQAGWAKPDAFVAPYDKLSSAALHEAARRFSVISGGWYELGRVPPYWIPRYLVKKIQKTPHWRVQSTSLLSHPGCILSRHHDYGTMMRRIVETTAAGTLTVLVTHWWEYFPEGQPDEPFIEQLHATAEYLASNREIQVVTFSDVAARRVPLN